MYLQCVQSSSMYMRIHDFITPSDISLSVLYPSLIVADKDDTLGNIYFDNVGVCP